MTIGIVGAGLAGLRAAQLLEAAGLDVQVFEARDRLGGRLHTVRLDQGGFYEAGAEWFDSSHYRILALAEELGLTLIPSDASPAKVVWQGDVIPEEEMWEASKEDSLKLHEAAMDYVRQLVEPLWDSQHLAHLDLNTLDEFLEDFCATDKSKWWASAIQRSVEGDDPDAIGLLGWLGGLRHTLDQDDPQTARYRIKEGAQEICERLAGRLKNPVLTHHVLHSVQLEEDSVQLWFEGEMAFVDRVLLTLPPKVLAEIDFGAALPVEKELAWEMIGSSRRIKVALQFTEPWWKNLEAQGRILTDLPCQEVNEGGREGAWILTATIAGDQADWVASHSDPVQAVLRSLCEVEPAASESFAGGWLHDWVDDEFARGAGAYAPPGAVMGALPHLFDPVERIHFAGEATAQRLGFAEGALESAERAVEELLIWKPK